MSGLVCVSTVTHRYSGGTEHPFPPAPVNAGQGYAWEKAIDCEVTSWREYVLLTLCAPQIIALVFRNQANDFDWWWALP
jgi:hypothetical protein